MGAFSIIVNGNTEHLACVYEDGIHSTRIWLSYINGAHMFLLRTPLAKTSLIELIKAQKITSLFLRKPRFMGYAGERRYKGTLPSKEDVGAHFDLQDPIAYVNMLCGETLAANLFASIYEYTPRLLLRIYAKNYDLTFWFIHTDKWYLIRLPCKDLDFYRRLRTNQVHLEGPHEVLHGAFSEPGVGYTLNMKSDRYFSVK